MSLSLSLCVCVCVCVQLWTSTSNTNEWIVFDLLKKLTISSIDLYVRTHGTLDTQGTLDKLLTVPARQPLHPAPSAI